MSWLAENDSIGDLMRSLLLRAVTVLRHALSVWLVAAELSSLQAAVSIPTLTGPVLDQAALLSRAEKEALEHKIRGLFPKLQIQVWTLESLEGEPIEGVSIRAVDQWKLGDARKDNGLLILVAKAERSVRIEVGQGLEGEISDSLSGRIVDHLMVPQFREGRFAQGLEAAIDEMAYRLGISQTPATIPQPQSRMRIPFWLVILMFMGIHFGFSMLIALARALGLVRRSSVSPWTRSSGWGGSWGGGFGGGGGWSGGGGGFSGGGASGRW